MWIGIENLEQWTVDACKVNKYKNILLSKQESCKRLNMNSHKVFKGLINEVKLSWL